MSIIYMAKFVSAEEDKPPDRFDEIQDGHSDEEVDVEGGREPVGMEPNVNVGQHFDANDAFDFRARVRNEGQGIGFRVREQGQVMIGDRVRIIAGRRSRLGRIGTFVSMRTESLAIIHPEEPPLDPIVVPLVHLRSLGQGM